MEGSVDKRVSGRLEQPLMSGMDLAKITKRPSDSLKEGDVVNFGGELARIVQIFILPDKSTRTILHKLTKKELREFEERKVKK